MQIYHDADDDNDTNNNDDYKEEQDDDDAARILSENLPNCFQPTHKFKMW